MDIFDVLDISLREDSYTSLVACALRQRDVRAAATAELMGIASGSVVMDGPVHFRKEFPNQDTRVKPDLWWDATVDDQSVRVILEFKIKSGEHDEQLRHYRELGSKDVGDVGLFFVTLNGKAPSDPLWEPLRHAELAAIIDKASATPLEKHPVWGDAWRTYRQRLDHYEQDSGMTDETALLPWLARTDRFVSAEDHIDTLAKRIIPDGWLGKGNIRQGTGGKRVLTTFQPPEWISEPLSKEQPSIANNYNVHFELVLSAKGNSSLQLHYETNPYMPEHKWEALNGHEEHRARKDRFIIHPSGDDWKTTRHANCKAKAVLPLTAKTTLGELRTLIQDRIRSIEKHVDAALGIARNSHIQE